MRANYGFRLTMDAVSGMFLAFVLIYFAITEGVEAVRLTAKNFQKTDKLNDDIYCDDET